MKTAIWATLFLALQLVATPQAKAADAPSGGGVNACRVLTSDDLYELFYDQTGGTLDSWAEYPAPDEAACRWEARLRDDPNGAPRRASLAYYRLADREAARTKLVAQGGTPNPPSDALVAGQDDELVQLSPTVVAARHGATVAVLDASEAAFADPTGKEPRYLFQALALKAAGAMVRPRTWTLNDLAASNGWIPPSHPTPAWATPLQPLLLVVAKMAAWRIFLIPVFIFAAILFPKGKSQSAESAGPGRSMRVIGPVALMVLAAVNTFASPWISASLLYSLGQTGTATIAASHGTATRYNGHNVLAYDVLIRTADHKVVRTHFQDDDFNIYPSHNSVTYPAEGDIFTVRYLPMFPTTFVIVADDASPWARERQCDRLERTDDQARANLKFAPDDAGSKTALEQADAALKAAACPASSN